MTHEYVRKEGKMTLQQLHYILTITRTGSLSKAAEELYITQPTLSGAVHDLEAELGVSLFHRSGKGMTLTNDGMEFVSSARPLYHQYEQLMEQYGKNGLIKKKFGISTQHYSFAVKSFVELVKKFNTAEYEFAIRETKTREVIEDVHTMRSEIGVLYLCDFNRKVMTKLLKAHDLEFHKLIECSAYVYLWKGHPLANNKSIRPEQLEPYPCLSFEQGNDSSYYYAEEMFSASNYPRTIKANDRATMLNLMVGLNGYTLCSGIICTELNGEDFIAVPYEEQAGGSEDKMEIGYIVKRNLVISQMGKMYIEEMKRYLSLQTNV